MYFEDEENIEFQYSDEDFTEGKLDFTLIPDYKVKYNKKGYVIEDDEYKRIEADKERNKILKKFSEYQHSEALWENFNRLTTNQQKAITLMVTGVTMKEIANQCNVNEVTIYRWMQIDIFTKTLRLWQKELFIEADLKIKSLVSKALNRLEFILDNPTKFEGRDYVRSIELCLNMMSKGEKK
jgi:hypothetical protein